MKNQEAENHAADGAVCNRSNPFLNAKTNSGCGEKPHILSALEEEILEGRPT